MGRRPFGHIKQRKGRPGWYVVFHHPDRKYAIERSTGMDKAVAQQKLAAVEALVKSGRPLAEILANVFGEKHGSRMTFREAVPLFLAHAKARLKPSTHKTHTSALSLLKKAAWAGDYLVRISPTALNRWKMERLAAGASGATVNRNRSVGSALFQWAIEMGHVQDNPFRRVKKEKETGRRDVYLTAAECAALVESCPRQLAPFVLAALHTGMRRGELIALMWRSVDLKRGVIHIEPETEKSGRGRVVPLTDRLKGVLADLRRERRLPQLDGRDPVFTTRDGRAWKAGTVSLAVRTAVRRCEGIPVEKRDRVTLHVFRHTAGSLIAQSGVSLFDLGKILGHGSPGVTARYAHFAPEAGRAAINRLGEALERGEREREEDGEKGRETA